MPLPHGWEYNGQEWGNGRGQTPTASERIFWLMSDRPPETVENLIVIFESGAVDPNEYPELASELLEARTTLGGETRYAMKFVERSHSALTVFDIVSLPGESYPVPQTALESLPPLALALLEREGAIQFQGAYNAEEQVFETVNLHWTNRTTIDRLGELLEADLSVHEAVDWLVVEEREQYTVSQWAEIRNVTEDAVKTNIKAARESILQEN